MRAAPIVRYMVGWTESQVVKYCKEKGWEVAEIGHTVKDKPTVSRSSEEKLHDS